MKMYGIASKLFNELLGIYLDEYKKVSDDKIEKMYPKYDPTNSTLDTYG